MIPEYFLIFSGEGDYVVQPFLDRKRLPVAEIKASPIDILKLVDSNTNNFITTLTIDDHFFTLIEVKIDTVKKIIKLKVAR